MDFNWSLPVMLRPDCIVHSPHFTKKFCFNFIRSSLSVLLIPSSNKICPDSPLNSTY